MAFLQWSLPRCCPCGDGEAFLGYQVIKGGFTIATAIFYDGFTVGLENVPKVGEPTILFFNHSNGLTDAMMTMRACPRMVRFVAKDTLWKMPAISWMINSAGAVPVQRKEEHGGDADTASMFEAVTQALERGMCVGIAPEGNSKMRTVLDEPFKKGAALMAVEAVFKHLGGDRPEFRVRLLPCGLSYMQRDRWRAAALVTYGEPILVDAELLNRHGVDQTMTDPRSSARQACVADIMGKLQNALRKVTLTCPASDSPADESVRTEGDWDVLRTAIVASRASRPAGQQPSLPAWVGMVRQFAWELSRAERRKEFDAVRKYHAGLLQARLADEQIGAAMKRGEMKPNCVDSLCGLMLSFVVCVLLLPLLLLGGACWLPVWLPCVLAERKILRQGKVVRASGEVERYRRNFDTIADSKMLIGFVVLTTMCVACCMWCWLLNGSVKLGIVAGCVYLPMLLWSTIFALEFFSFSARSALQHWAMLTVSNEQWLYLAEERRRLHTLLESLYSPVVDMPAVAWGGPVAHVCPHRKTDWQQTLSVRDDLSFSALQEDCGSLR